MRMLACLKGFQIMDQAASLLPKHNPLTNMIIPKQALWLAMPVTGQRLFTRLEIAAFALPQWELSEVETCIRLPLS